MKVSLLFSNNVGIDIDETLNKSTEGQVIKVFLDNTSLMELWNNKRFITVIFYPGRISTTKHRPAAIIAWFTYTPTDENITVNYFYFPKLSQDKRLYTQDTINSQNTSRIIVKDRQLDQIQSFYNDIIHSKAIPSNCENKRLNIHLPNALSDDNLLNKSKKIDDISSIVFDGKSFYWGIKSNQFNYIRDKYNYYFNEPLFQTISETFETIELAILAHETPKSWHVSFGLTNIAEESDDPS
jgi:hypothetical protein